MEVPLRNTRLVYPFEWHPNYGLPVLLQTNHSTCLHKHTVIQDYINPNKVDTKFTIQGPTGNNISCWAVLDSPSEVAAENWSFSHKGCRNSQWSFGWGYDDYQDTGVLSVFE